MDHVVVSCPVGKSRFSGQEKCAQYWPTVQEQQMCFPDTGFVVRLLVEEEQSSFTIRSLQLQNIKVSRGRLFYICNNSLLCT